jgi:hypothetical protein
VAGNPHPGLLRRRPEMDARHVERCIGRAPLPDWRAAPCPEAAEFYLRAALLWAPDPVKDPLTHFVVITRFGGLPDSAHRDLMNHKDNRESYDEVRALIVEARAMAQAEPAAKHERRGTGKPMQPVYSGFWPYRLPITCGDGGQVEAWSGSIRAALKTQFVQVKPPRRMFYLRIGLLVLIQSVFSAPAQPVPARTSSGRSCAAPPR